MLTREQILGAEDLKSEIVPVPEWGGEIRVREISAAGRLLMAELVKQEVKDARVAWMICCTVDLDGDAVFTVEDVAALMKKSSAALDRVWAAIQRVQGLGAKQAEDAEKN